MDTKIILQKQDLTYLKWSHSRNSSGTAGTFLKSEASIGNRKIYYKLSNFDADKGVIGNECVNEIIVDRLLTLLGVEHLHYQLINALIDIDGKQYSTYLCASEDFKERGESKTSLENYYIANHLDGESRYEFCKRLGFEKNIDTMIAVDYIILNRDRHGANIEVLRNSRQNTLRIAPLFDHGLSFMFACTNDNDIQSFDIMEDKACNNFVGGKSCFENLKYIKGKKVFARQLVNADRAFVFEDLEGIISDTHIDCIWNMIMERYNLYENL